jgi:hypothetical protein
VFKKYEFLFPFISLPSHPLFLLYPLFLSLVDCWDGENDEPIVYHGYTLTTKILFKEILADAIKPYAFVSSRYPLILSLENHCSEPFQLKMAEHLQTILGDMLYLVDPHDNLNDLPSPDDLQGRILIKAKKRPEKPGAALSPISPSTPQKQPQSPQIPLPPNSDDEDEEKSPTSEKDIDFLGEGDTDTINAVAGIDDGLLSPTSPGWAGPPKVYKLSACSSTSTISSKQTRALLSLRSSV